MKKLACHLSALLLATLLLASVAGADWLVTRDGDRIETEGEWKVKGKMVVFTMPGGTLTSMRLADVDLDASAVLTEKAKNPPPPSPPPAEPPRAVLVFTDADIKQAAPETPPGLEAVAADAADTAGSAESSGGAEDAGEDSGEEGEGGEASEPGGLQVESWRISESDQVDGVEIFGSLRNRGTEMAAELSLVARVWDEDGNQLAEQSAFLKNSSLLPGRATSFRVLLPGLSSLPTDPVFEVKSRGIRMN